MPGVTTATALISFGEVTEHPWRDGRTITFGARFRAYDKRRRISFGTNAQGWNHVRAEIELETIAQQVERGTWVPPEDRKYVARKQTQRSKTAPLFGPFAREVVDGKQSHGLDDDTIADLEWKLSYLTARFGADELFEIDVEATDGFRDALARQSQAIRRAAQQGKPITETVKTKTGNTYKRRKKPLSNTSINSILRLLSQILQRAADYDYIERNPMKVGRSKDRYLPAVKPKRTFLEVDELHALLAAAGELDASARRDRRIGRRASLATLALDGFRVSEVCGFKVPQVDLRRARFKLPDAKTPKGVREVEMPVWLHVELRIYYQQRVQDKFPMRPKDFFFGTSTGRRRDTDRYRDRVLARSVARANANRESEGFAPLPERITPHSLRRTWAMLAAQAGRDPHWISDQIGHTSAAFTLQVYQQTRHRRLTRDERQAVWELMRFADEPELCPFTR